MLLTSKCLTRIRKNVRIIHNTCDAVIQSSDAWNLISSNEEYEVKVRELETTVREFREIIENLNGQLTERDEKDDSLHKEIAKLDARIRIRDVAISQHEEYERKLEQQISDEIEQNWRIRRVLAFFSPVAKVCKRVVDYFNAEDMR